MKTAKSYKQKYEELEKSLGLGILHALAAGMQDPEKIPLWIAAGIGTVGAIKYGSQTLNAIKRMMGHFHRANDVTTEGTTEETPSLPPTTVPPGFLPKHGNGENESPSLPPHLLNNKDKSIKKSFDMETMAHLTGKSVERIQQDIANAEFLGNSAFIEPVRIANPQQGVAERMLVAEYTPPINADLMNDNFIHQMSLISNLSHDEVIAKLSRAEFNGNPFYQGKKNV